MGPDPTVLHPIPAAPSLVWLAPLAKGRARIEVGAYSYYDDADAPERFFERNLRYHFDFGTSWLRIGPFCAIASGVQILMDGANHAMDGLSTYPFDIFHADWQQGFSSLDPHGQRRGDTAIGADVWIGTDAMILPCATIGPGAIIGAGAVVGGEIPPYAIAAGNPARVVRFRFPEETIARLLAIAWWDWPVEKLTTHLNLIRSGDLDGLERVA
ncbi:MAG: CatB-related O-acetyltransferase [Pseudomonadota bacterium]